MYLKKILVAVDGSRNSQMASEYGFWLASKLAAKIAGQHVVDPRLVDLFIEPEFAEELGIAHAMVTREKVFAALKRIGESILELFASRALIVGVNPTCFLDEGHIVEQILKYSQEFDLLVLGHRGKGDSKLPGQLMLGSVAERIALHAKVPLLIAVQPIEHIKEVVVAFDGSEASRGALLMAEELAKETDCQLRAITVMHSAQNKGEAQALVEQGQSYLREEWKDDVFSISYGGVPEMILEHAASSQCLLVLGAYGYTNADENALGSTTTSIIRQARTSVLIYRPRLKSTEQKKQDSLTRLNA